MKHFIFFFSSIYLFLSSLNALAEGNPIRQPQLRASCLVKAVFVGNIGTGVIIELFDCKGNTSFRTRRLHLQYRVENTPVEFSTSGETIRHDNTAEYLSFKQTAELAYLFQKRVTVYFYDENDTLPAYMLLSEQIIPKAEPTSGSSGGGSVEGAGKENKTVEPRKPIEAKKTEPVKTPPKPEKNPQKESGGTAAPSTEGFVPVPRT